MPKCPKCNIKLQDKKSREKISVVLLDDNDITFLEQSNYIEREWSDEAMEDAMTAYRYAFLNRKSADLKYILELHNILMKRLNTRIAGNIRQCKVWVGDREGMEYKLIEKALLKWLKTSFKLVTEEDIKQSHVDFELIHPFEDGNGRTGRILLNIQRINAGLEPIIIHEGREQMSYYKWFRQEAK